MTDHNTQLKQSGDRALRLVQRQKETQSAHLSNFRRLRRCVLTACGKAIERRLQ